MLMQHMHELGRMAVGNSDLQEQHLANDLRKTRTSGAMYASEEELEAMTRKDTEELRWPVTCVVLFGHRLNTHDH